MNAASSQEELERLAARVRDDLARIGYATGEWSIPRLKSENRVLDVAIIGAGQGGLAACFALRRLGVTNVEVFDRAHTGQEGPWTTFARMITLRTPKHVTGPDLGIPSLTLQSWYEARCGTLAWQALNKISREDWQSYLDWLRATLSLPIQNDSCLVDVGWRDGLLRLTFESEGGKRTERWARKLILATGIDGGGAWHVPDFIIQSLQPSRYAHTSQQIDFNALRGRRVGVLGAGASAFDNAATALEHGAASVDLCLRRKAIPAVNPYRWMENAGFLGHFPDLPDETRWRFMHRIYDLNQPPPQETFWRCRQHGNFTFHPGTPWLSVRDDGEKGIIVVTPHGEMSFDFLIIGTGFVLDLMRRPETRSFADAVALWRDRFVPPQGQSSSLLGSHPYLGTRFQFLPRDAGDPRAPMLNAIHNFTFSAMPSMGLSGASISGMRFGVDRLARGVARDLFVEDGERHLQSFLSYDVTELVSLDPPDAAHAI
ncbi:MULTISPECIES: NAD(P)-binding domain-containing protein [Asaia]|uniref:NAD(P)-binding domain-containing protein n=1 Tax=Asaia TaxID=91914 RepID=UPI0025543F0E|nr:MULTISPECIES: NAD(P)/FAD-dependent oxidoreductase [Asaia]MDL2172544.1 NAD(P)/FAD-dependent oxidoreductase [Asaia sp. HumB]